MYEYEHLQSAMKTMKVLEVLWDVVHGGDGWVEVEGDGELAINNASGDTTDDGTEIGHILLVTLEVVVAENDVGQLEA